MILRPLQQSCLIRTYEESNWLNKFFGTAEFDYQRVKKKVRICLNLEQNIFEIRYSPSRKELDKAIFTRAEGTARLTNILVHLPTGTLYKPIYDDFFVVSYRQSLSMSVSQAATAFDLLDNEEGITHINLHPRSSRVEFEFRPFRQATRVYELFYQGNRASLIPPREIKIGAIQTKAFSHSSGFTVQASHSLKRYEELIRLSWALVQGGPLTLRSIFDGSKIVLNMAAHHGSTLGHLYKRLDDSGVLFQAFIDFFSQLGKLERTKWSKATYFYLQGLGGNIPIEIRAINLFTFLEIVDEAETIEKRSVGKLLGIHSDEADLICRVRNRLIHRGESLGDAFVDAYNELSQFKEAITNSIFPIDMNNKETTGVNCFFRFASLLNRMWISKIKFKGEWNDFSDYRI
jgi:hypothetical protein